MQEMCKCIFYNVIANEGSLFEGRSSNFRRQAAPSREAGVWCRLGNTKHEKTSALMSKRPGGLRRSAVVAVVERKEMLM